ncbi:MAG: T9SS type A sorting domain-containing protein [Bacteroidia bacterium]|nr:T9SS type A sorting domain-containing protein [Bacteroidia bacterium]
MKKLFFPIFFLLISLAKGQNPPPLHIQFVSHNEPTDNLDQNLKYLQAKSKALQMADLMDTYQVKWNLQTSDGFVFGARKDQQTSGNNIFKMLSTAPYTDNIEIDPRNKNSGQRNIADQWYLLDSLGGNPSYTLGGFLWYVCQPSSITPDWFQYEDTITGTVHGNKLKLKLISGPGSGGATMHCNDLNDFGVWKPHSVDSFYVHDGNQALWNVGIGCAPVLDSTSNEQEIIDLIQGQVDSIQQGFWPQDQFYITKIMTNQRDYGPAFFQKLTTVLDSLTQIPSTQLKWVTISEAFAEFENWQTATGKSHSQWLCGQTAVGRSGDILPAKLTCFPNPTRDKISFEFSKNGPVRVKLLTLEGKEIREMTFIQKGQMNLSGLVPGIYLLQAGNSMQKVVKF